MNHQGVVAYAASADYVSADEIFENASEIPLLVLLDGVEDPRNFGAILRTVEVAGADGVFIPERRAVGLTETVAKSAAGATEYVRVAKVQNLNRLIDDLKARNIWVVGTSGVAEKDYFEWDWRELTALVLGGEGKRFAPSNCGKVRYTCKNPDVWKDRIIERFRRGRRSIVRSETTAEFGEFLGLESS